MNIENRLKELLRLGSLVVLAVMEGKPAAAEIAARDELGDGIAADFRETEAALEGLLSTDPDPDPDGMFSPAYEKACEYAQAALARVKGE